MESILFSEPPEVADLLIRATVLLGAGIASTLLLRRLAAQVRHLAWTVIFAILLVLPLGMLLLPSWDVPILPASEADTVAEPGYLSASNAPLPIEVRSSTQPDETHSFYHEDGLVIYEQDAIAGQYIPDVKTLFFWIWVTGITLALLSLVIGKLKFQWLVRHSEPVLDPDWIDQLDILKDRLGISRNVRLLMNRSVSTPMTSGSLRPVVLVPDSALTWSEDRIELVLAHELIHVHRFDALRQFISRIVLGIYWFHPLSWFASRMASICREQACDAEVLLLGSKPSSYAHELLSLADGMTNEPSYAVLPMIRKSQLEKRLMAILDPNRPQKNIIVNAFVFLLVSILGIATVIARPVSPVVLPIETVPITEVGPAQEAPQAPKTVTVPIAPEPVAPEVALAPIQENVPLEPSVIPERIQPAAPEMVPVPPKKVSEAHLKTHEDITCEVSPTSAFGETFNFSGSFSTKTADGLSRNQYSGTQNSDRVVQMYAGDMRLCMRLHGNITIDEKSSLHITIHPNRKNGIESWAVIEAEDSKLYKMVITGSELLERTFSIDGEIKEIDEKAGEWMKQVVSILNSYAQSSELQGKAGEYKEEIDALRGNVIEMRSTLDLDGSHVSELRAKAEELKAHENDLLRELELAMVQEDNMRAEIAALQNHLSELNAKASAESEEAVAEYRARIKEMKNAVDEYDAKEKIAALKKELEASKYDKKVEEIQKVIEEYSLKEKMQRQQAELEALKMKERATELNAKLIELDANKRSKEIERRMEKKLKRLIWLMEAM